jgi:hypothetical protein
MTFVALLIVCAMVLARQLSAEEAPARPLVECPAHTAWTLLLAALTNDRQEVRGRGLSHDGIATLLFTDEDGAIWVSVSVRVDGQACIFDHGKNWTPLGIPGTAS